MSAALELSPRPAPRAFRERWQVSPREVGPDGLLAPSALVARAVSVAAALGASGEPGAVSIQDLQVLTEVYAGATLVITAALERQEAGARVVSVVIRHGEPGTQGGVAVAGVLRFTGQGAAPAPAPSSWLRQTARRSASQGLTPVEARFRAAAGPEPLGRGSLVERLQELSLVSAQGFAGGPLAFEAVHALSLLGPVRPGQPLVLRCSVVHAEGTRVTVLAHLAGEEGGGDLLWALTSFRSARPVPAVRPTGVDGQALSRVLAPRT